MKQNKRLKSLVELIERERTGTDYHSLTELGGLYDVMVREADRLVLNRAFKI